MTDQAFSPAMHPIRPVPVIYLALLAILAMLGTDIYLPALGEIQTDLSGSVFQVGLSLTVYAASPCLVQLLYGPLSDAMGRKPVLLAGLAMFVAATLGCLLVRDIGSFLMLRFLQAIGVCTATVLWQPIVIDIHAGDDKRVRDTFGFVMSFVGISPALAPLAGGAIAAAFGWRYTFVVLLALGALLLAWTAALYRETHPRERRAVHSIRAHAILAPYRTLLGDRHFHLHAWPVAAAVGGYLAYLTIAPFTLAHLGLTPVAIGLSFLPLACLFGLGSAAARRIAGRYSDKAALQVSAALAALAGALFWLSVESGFATTPVRYVSSFGLVAFAIGIIIPTGSAGAIARFALISGACSSAINCLISITALVTTTLVSLGYQADGNRPLGAILVATGLISLACATALRPVHDHPTPPPA
ncbi:MULTISPECIES: Bcr/CflA family efflux MFS transporter [unclassified Burkholderia]|uniref:Bcr/CflA family efflux MFS transporter n=1 Tax=unclassified Burkholderia TaxID=2613784 RepID=UPI001421C251|nr:MULTISPECIES: Bcr/CflA family efflux MFS transporter [unclassified Burkholderia]NIE82525.1 multidrug effflux MFS transporter [Burkholderia sp. Tr-860]NIF61302.1 multidrug effflux MFS transporter [Burkholderia sp. Cy-647]NIF94507.1 multidrug effflux MFS transporter [Burkholderia sp. Ax-1720]